MRTKTGTVTSTKMDKTAVISVHTYHSHPKYKKKFRKTRKFYSHDENQICKEGDTATIAEHRPMSKLKRWRVIAINGKSIETSDNKNLSPTA